MGKLSARKKRLKRTVEIGTVDPAAGAVAEDLDARIEAIQLLVPLGTGGGGRRAAEGGHGIGRAPVSTQGVRSAVPSLGLSAGIGISG